MIVMHSYPYPDKDLFMFWLIAKYLFNSDFFTFLNDSVGFLCVWKNKNKKNILSTL